MTKIALVTDSTADTPADILEKYDIHVIPCLINYSDRSYHDRVDIQPEEVYARFEEEVPKTSLPSPGEVDQLFTELEEQGYTHVLGVTIASRLSGTHDLIHSVAVGHSNLTCDIVDTHLIGLGAGMVVAATAKKLGEGASFEEAAAYARKAAENTHMYFCVDTLDYLYKGGRIGKVAYQMGSKFDIRPVITLVPGDGTYVTAAKAHGRKASLKKAIKLVLEHAEGAEGKSINFAVAHSNAEAEALPVLEKMKDALPESEYVFAQITPSMVVHTGPGLIGLGIQLLDD